MCSKKSFSSKIGSLPSYEREGEIKRIYKPLKLPRKDLEKKIILPFNVHCPNPWR